MMSTNKCQVMVPVARRNRCSNIDRGILLCNLVYICTLIFFKRNDIHSEVIY
jgi:hypothetical protein